MLHFKSFDLFQNNSFNLLTISLINQVSFNDILTPLCHSYVLMNYIYTPYFKKTQLIKLYTR